MGGGLAEAVGAELDRLAPSGPVGVAVSGGGDSTALMILAREWTLARGRSIAAATVDHRLRPESAAEAEAVAALCRRMDIPHRILVAGDLRGAGGNLTATGREARFALLGGWAREHGLPMVLLGHTLDDQAETVLMRLARGSGAEGLSAMQAAMTRDGLTWLRPLLGLRREDLRDWLRTQGIAWSEDPTNERPEFDRVKVRQALAALAPLGIDAEGLARTAWHLQRQRRVLERAMTDLANRARHWGELGEARLDTAALAADEQDTGLRLLADTLMRVSGAPYRPRFRALSAVFEAALSGRNEAMTLSGCLIRPHSGQLLICREPSACEAPAMLGGSEETIWDRRWRVRLQGSYPGSARIGATGERGLALLRAAAEANDWVSPENWATALRAVRLTAPAIWRTGPAGLPGLLAVPHANFPDKRKIDAECAVNAEFLGSEELRIASPAEYGPAGCI